MDVWSISRGWNAVVGSKPPQNAYYNSCLTKYLSWFLPAYHSHLAPEVTGQVAECSQDPVPVALSVPMCDLP